MTTQLPPPPPPIGAAGSYPGAPAPFLVSPSSSLEGASWGARLGAWFLDGLVVGGPSLILLIIVIASAPREELQMCEIGGTVALCEPLTPAGSFMVTMTALAGTVGGIIYYALMEGRSGQTLGKRAASIMVVDADTGAPIGAGRAIGRYFARILSGLPLLLGYLWPLWDDRQQAFHDKLVNSRVVTYASAISTRSRTQFPR